jgi:hypothetical protein
MIPRLRLFEELSDVLLMRGEREVCFGHKLG